VTRALAGVWVTQAKRIGGSKASSQRKIELPTAAKTRSIRFSHFFSSGLLKDLEEAFSAICCFCRGL
jgi:hypothetical protein